MYGRIQSLVLLACSITASSLLLAGCATEDSVLLPTSLAETMRSSDTALVFTDDSTQARVIMGHWNVPAAAIPVYELNYGPAWNSSKAISDVHARELRSFGVRATSVFDMFSDAEVRDLTTGGIDQREKHGPAPILTARFMDALREKNRNYLLWITWSGFRYYWTLGSSPVEQFGTSYWLYDLSQRKLVWNGGLATIQETGIKPEDAREFFGADNFARLQGEILARMSELYGPGDDSVPWLLRLQLGAGVPTK